MNKLLLLAHTIKFLKPIQIYSRLYYVTRNKFRKTVGISYPYSKASVTVLLNLQKSLHINDCSFPDNEFKFLNLSKKFHNNIAWNYSQYGKLWTYNLSYFDFLTQNYDAKQLEIINDFIANIEDIKDGMEPFPISLRGINWIKFLSYHNIREQEIDDALYAQYYILLDNIEYHLLGNHLLENAFSLLYGAYYFQDDLLYEKSKKILYSELNEQILGDGAHFELSPMYHQIMLFRLLDCINLVKNNNWKDQDILEFLIAKAELMLGWLKAIAYQDDSIPLLNDSANGISPTSKELYAYAQRLNISTKILALNESAYRKVLTNHYEMVIDVGHIGADYIPGHAHSDTFSFELRRGNAEAFIVDTGLSTYEPNERRTVERSTASHNTVEINGKSQSEVWGGFRVANRAQVTYLKESVNSIEATHDGYKKSSNILHTRKWTFEENKIIIEDSLTQEADAVARFHFHPNITESEIHNSFNLEGHTFNIIHYNYSPEFNTQIDAYVLEIKFSKSLKVEIGL